MANDLGLAYMQANIYFTFGIQLRATIRIGYREDIQFEGRDLVYRWKLIQFQHNNNQ